MGSRRDWPQSLALAFSATVVPHPISATLWGLGGWIQHSSGPRWRQTNPLWQMDPCVSSPLLWLLSSAGPRHSTWPWLSDLALAPACWVPSYSSRPLQCRPSAIGTTHSLAQGITKPRCPPLLSPLPAPVTSHQTTLSVSGLTLPVVSLRLRPLQRQAGKPWALVSVGSHAGSSTERPPALGRGSLPALRTPCYIRVTHGALFSTTAVTKCYRLSVSKQHKSAAVL